MASKVRGLSLKNGAIILPPARSLPDFPLEDIPTGIANPPMRIALRINESHPLRRSHFGNGSAWVNFQHLPAHCAWIINIPSRSFYILGSVGKPRRIDQKRHAKRRQCSERSAATTRRNRLQRDTVADNPLHRPQPHSWSHRRRSSGGLWWIPGFEETLMLLCPH